MQVSEILMALEEVPNLTDKLLNVFAKDKVLE